MKKTFLMTLALLCAVAQGAWAQTEVGTEAALTEVINGDGSNKAVKMTADITLGSHLVIENGKNVTLDLNGHKLSRSLTEYADDGNVVRVETGGQLTVKDSSGNDSGQITGGKAINGGGICNHGTLTFEGGTITGCSASTNGGGIYNAPETSGAVSMTIKGGSITGNTCGDRGAGIFNYPGCFLNIQGTVNVSGNTKGSEANNVYLDGETVFTVTGALTGSTIGVSIFQSCRIITSGYETNNSADGATFFSSDNSISGITQNGDEMFFGRSATFNVRSWDETSKQVVTTQVTKVCTPIEGNNPNGWMTLTNGYYVVTGNVEYQALTIVGSDVHLILADGCKLNCRHIKLEQGNSLHIHSESDGDNKGQLYAENNEKTGTYFEGAAAIGGGDEQNSGSLYVHGGYVKAWAESKTLFHGDAGIGGGEHYGIGGEVVIYGGKVDAVGTAGAGIGGGCGGNQGGPITIYGGDVSAEGTKGGAGIGGGSEHDGGSVYIYGGYVSATGSNWKVDSQQGTIIEGYAAGIGSGEGKYAGDLHIYGGIVKPAGGAYSQCVTGSVEIATGMKVGTKDGNEPVAAADRVKTCYITGKWNYLTILPCTHDGNFIYTIIDETKHSRVCEYCGVTVEEAHTYTDGVCVCGQRYGNTLDYVLLYDTQDNTTTLASNNGKAVNVTLDGRTLYKDGSWNTLCLPFGLGDFTGTPLEGATVKTLESSEFDGASGTLTLKFTSGSLAAISAGVPYIVKWALDTDITNPVFTDVTIRDGLSPVTTDYVDFSGSFSPVNLEDNDRSVLYLGADNKLYYPSANMTVGSCRALFQLKDITAGDLASGANARRFVLNFGDGDETTGIISIDNGQLIIDNSMDAWYTLDGRRLTGKPTAKGLYINNGRKVVIK